MPDLHIRLQGENSEDIKHRPILEESAAMELLGSAEISAAKLVPWGSNYTFAVSLSDGDGGEHLGIYKPQAGERPLWDFPSGTLYLREYASYRLSQWLGWDLVPPTVIRDGPHGVGSLQLYVEPNTEEIDESQFWGRRILQIEQMVMFDHLTNNADRKIGHCLVDTCGRIWGIDHGLTFNADPKLRTVLWQFSGEPIGAEVLADVTRLHDEGEDLFTELGELFQSHEIDALRSRVAGLLQTGHYPILDPHYNIPYGWW